MKLTPLEDVRRFRAFLGLNLFGAKAADGFTFVELLVALGIGAAVLAAVVLSFRTMGASGNRLSSYEPIPLGNQVIANFYGANTNEWRTWVAPNYGRIAQADQLREYFTRDIQRSVAVYCLPRAGRSVFRPPSLTLPSAYAFTNFDFRRVDTAEAFRQFFVAALPASASTFSNNPYSSSGAVNNRNLSVFMINGGNNVAVFFSAIYEVDFVRVTNSPTGTFASVRRYAGTNRVAPSHYYDVFYRDDADGTVVNSVNFYVAASFERANRTANTTVAANRVATSQPFYFVWWPDPSATFLPTTSGSYSNSMSNHTSYMTVVPMFPAL